MKDIRNVAKLKFIDSTTKILEGKNTFSMNTLVITISELLVLISWIDKSETLQYGDSSDMPRNVAVNFFL